MNKFLKKSVALTLMLSVLLTAFFAVPISASASSYKYDFIDALLKNEDVWYTNWGPSVRYQSAITFIDLDFDGKLELIMQYGGGTMGNCEADAFYLDGNKVCKAESDNKTANRLGFENGLSGYYDVANGEYVMLGTSRFYFKEDIVVNNRFQTRNHVWQGDFFLNYDSNRITTDYYASSNMSGIFGSEFDTFDYYLGANTYANSTGCELATEEEYYNYLDSIMANLIDIEMRTEYIMCEDWETYSYDEKYEALEWAYDGFSYKRYPEDFSSQLGDVDGDGEVSVIDATAIQLYIAEIADIDDTGLSVADTDNDGDVSILDATQIQLFLAQLIPEL